MSTANAAFSFAPTTAACTCSTVETPGVSSGACAVLGADRAATIVGRTVVEAMILGEIVSSGMVSAPHQRGRGLLLIAPTVANHAGPAARGLRRAACGERSSEVLAAHERIAFQGMPACAPSLVPHVGRACGIKPQAQPPTAAQDLVTGVLNVGLGGSDHLSMGSVNWVISDEGTSAGNGGMCLRCPVPGGRVVERNVDADPPCELLWEEGWTLGELAAPEFDWCRVRPGWPRKSGLG